MADSRIHNLTEDTALVDTDWLVAEVGDSEARKVSVATLRATLGFWDAVVVKGTTETISASTTFQNDDELFFTAVGASPYFFELGFVYDSVAAADIKLDFALSAGSATRAWRQYVGFGPTTIVIHAGQDNDLSTAYQSGSNTGEKNLKIVRGFVLPSTNCTVNLRWAQVVSDPGNTSVVAGSYLAYRQMV